MHAFHLMTMMNKGHVLQLLSATHCNYKVLYFRKQNPACLLLTPLLFLLLCFTANKLLHIKYKIREGADSIKEDSSPCLISASSYDELQPFVPTKDLLLLPESNKQGKAARNTEAEMIFKGQKRISAGNKKLDYHKHKHATRFPQACKGKLIYIYPLPAEFNEELVERCRVGYKRYCDKWFCIPCNCLENHGFGPMVPHNQTKVNQGLGKEDGGVRLIPEKAWYRSDQFSGEVIFYEKMKRHVCVTKDASEANAFYIPFFGGLDAGFILFSNHTHIRDELTLKLVGWLSGNPVWQQKREAPHFMVLGHVAWDFNRKLLEGDGLLHDDGASSTTWGTSLFFQPTLSNVTWLLPERKVTKNDMGIPFPTLFHPSSPTDIFLWQEQVRKAKRPWLVTFVGGSTRKFAGDMTQNLRIILMSQCKEQKVSTMTSNTNVRCKAVECISGEEMKKKRSEMELLIGERGMIENELACNDEPEEVMRALAKSVFCLQPKGDSYTRKAFFDTIVAGCIPVLFSNATAYLQYEWHLPSSPSLYSVFIPEADILANHVNVVETLSRIPSAHIKMMQKTIYRLIPHVVYSHPSSTLQDAFSITLDAFFMHKKT